MWTEKQLCTDHCCRKNISAVFIWTISVILDRYRGRTAADFFLQCRGIGLNRTGAVMAEKASQGDDEDLGPDESGKESECPGCQSVGTLTLPCGHKLCPACIQLSRAELGRADPGQGGCTICYGSQLIDSVLQTLLEVLFHDRPRRRVRGGEESLRTAKDGRPPGGDDDDELLCESHREPLSEFCLEDGEPLCPSCRTDEHNGHRCCNTEEAVRDCKRELRAGIRRLHEQLDTLTSVRQTWEETASHIKNQAAQASQLLKEEFEKMHQFLRDEEAALMSELKQEEEEKTQKMKEKTERLDDDINVLTSNIAEIEHDVALDDFFFLKNYKKASERAQLRVEEPEDESESLLDTSKHQSCVQHRVWEKMLKIIQYYPVTMDPNTCSPCLSVSPDMSSVSVCDEQQLPDNPERFTSRQSVLGSEDLDSGRHSWEVEVGDNSHWALGVASDSILRKDRPGSARDPETDGGLWTVSLARGEVRASPGLAGALKLRRRPSRVRVQLDWERGCLTFSDANDNSLIHRFKQQWGGAVRPYFSTTCSKHPLKITAARVNVNVE